MGGRLGKFGGQLGATADHVRAGSVDRVRGRLGEGLPIAAQGSVQVAEVSFGLGRRLLIAARRPDPVVHRTSQHHADAHLPGRFDHGQVVLVPPVVQVEEIDGRRDARLGHLGEGEQRAGLDPLAVEPVREGVEDQVSPRHEPEVVAEPTEECLERVPVAVHRPRQHGYVPPVLAFLLEDVLQQEVLPVFRIGTSRHSVEGDLHEQLRGIGREAGVRHTL